MEIVMGDVIAFVLIGGFMSFCGYGALLLAFDSDERRKEKLDKDQ